MAYLWYDRIDKRDPERRWRIRLDDGTEMICRAAFGINRGATIADGQSRGLPVNFVVRFDETEAQFIDSRVIT